MLFVLFYLLLLFQTHRELLVRLLGSQIRIMRGVRVLHHVPSLLQRGVLTLTHAQEHFLHGRDRDAVALDPERPSVLII